MVGRLFGSRRLRFSCQPALSVAGMPTEMLHAILTLLALISASIVIHAEYSGPEVHIYLFKPLTMGFILLIAARAGKQKASRYRYAIVAGLLCSLAGDIFLMLPSDPFVAGLVSFLVAHLFYIVAFTAGREFRFSLRSFGPFVLYGILMLAILWPHLGNMKLPVLVYTLVLLVMARQAWERWSRTEQRGALLAFLGTVSFVISDSALSIDRFLGQFAVAPALILGTYFTAQWLIALSVREESGT